MSRARKGGGSSERAPLASASPAAPPPNPGDDRHPHDRLERGLGLGDATLLVVSSVIGVGIFLTPGGVAASLPSPGLFLLAWLVGGLLSLAGALANAELGAMYPHAGGDYVYLREAIHPIAGFLVGWLSFFVIYAGTVATLAVGFADGLAPVLALGEWGRIGVALAVTALTSAINFVGLRAGATFNNLTAVVKLATLFGFVVAGPLLVHGGLSNLASPAPGAGGAGAGSFGLALSPVLFSYLGWNASVYVASEIRDPGRNVPRSLFLGLGVCMLLYLGVNALYLVALSMPALAGEPRAGEAAARALFGPIGGGIAAGLILASILGCLNATILVGPRIAYAMAIDGLFFRGSERVHARNRTPHIAIAVQAATAATLILVLQRFPSVLDYTTFAIVLATMADTAALYALRRRRPERRRPYRAWGYPLVPGFYLVANGLIALAMLKGRPLECAIGLLVTATGVPFYLAFERRRARSRASARAGSVT